MAFKFKDLIVTLVPHGLPEIAATSGPCGPCTETCTATVGSCSSEGVLVEFECFDSGEVLEVPPYSNMDSRYQLELKQLLAYSLAKSGINTKFQSGENLENLEKQMYPQSLKEIEVLEKAMTTALHEIQQKKKELQNKTKLR